MVITKRDMIFGIFMTICVISIAIYSHISILTKYSDIVSMYSNATTINDSQAFNTALKTDIGDVLAYGEVVAQEPVSFDEIDGEYLYIRRTREVYTRHTNARPVIIGKIATTYSWDKDSSEELFSKEYTFLGATLDDNTIWTDKKTRPVDLYTVVDDTILHNIDSSFFGIYKYDSKYLYTSPEVRYYYEYIPSSLYGTIYSDMRNSKLNNSEFFPEYTQSMVIQKAREDNLYYILSLWIFWIILLVTTILLYVNTWRTK